MSRISKPETGSAGAVPLLEGGFHDDHFKFLHALAAEAAYRHEVLGPKASKLVLHLEEGLVHVLGRTEVLLRSYTNNGGSLGFGGNALKPIRHPAEVAFSRRTRSGSDLGRAEGKNIVSRGRSKPSRMSGSCRSNTHR